MRLETALRFSIIFLAIVMGLPVGFALSAPSISGVSGTVANGETITISGSGFGATGPTVVLFDSFEGGTSGNSISTSANSADVEEWSSVNDNIGTYSTTYAKSGSKSMRINWATASTGGPSVYFSDVQNSDLAISWWQYMPTASPVPGTNVSSPNWKWFWIGDNDDGWPIGSDYVITLLSNDNDGGGITHLYGNDEGSPTRWQESWFDTTFRKGTWMRCLYISKNATSGGYVWYQEVDTSTPQIVINQSGVVTAHSDDPWNVFVLPGYGRVQSDSNAYYDDVYVATGAGARARVEIGNNSTYTSCTNLALITPTSWGDTSITATVRQGSFAAEETAYLFVVDSSGTVSSAEAITIGAGEEDTTAPTVTISTANQTITTDSLSISGTAYDETALSYVKCRIGSAPDASNGTTMTGTTSWSGTLTGFSSGSNTVYCKSKDTSDNWSTADTATITYTPPDVVTITGTTLRGVVQIITTP